MKRSEIHNLITNKLNKTYGIVDGHWFFADALLQDLEDAGMLPPPDHVEPLSIDGQNGIILEVWYNHGPAANSNNGIYVGWEEETED